MTVRWLLLIALVYGLLLFAAIPQAADLGRTPDSYGYLASAEALRAGKGYVWEGTWNSMWPIGYSAAIALIQLLTGLPGLWASKVVNLLAIWGLLFFLYREYRERALVPALAAGYLLKLATYTWSETLFVTVLVVAAHRLARFLEGKTHVIRYLIPAACLFLVRYVGGFLGILTGIVPFFFRQVSGRRTSGPAAILLAGYAAYFGLNKILGDHVWGGPRFVETEPLPVVVGDGIAGWLNEAVLVRDAPPSDILWWAGLVLQAGLAVGVIRVYRLSFGKWETGISRRRILLYVAAGYSVIVTFLRFLSPFDVLGYRLLAPATLLVCIALLDWLSLPSRAREWSKIRIPVSLFFMAVTIGNLLPREILKLRTLLHTIIPGL